MVSESSSVKSAADSSDSGGRRFVRYYDLQLDAGHIFTHDRIGGDHKIMHLVPLSFLGFPIGRGFKTALMASSNTLFRFLCVNAEHSRYL